MVGGLLWWAIVGLIAGFLAGKVMKGGGFGVIMDIVIGIIGALLGGWVFRPARNVSRRRTDRLDLRGLRRRLSHPALARAINQKSVASGRTGFQPVGFVCCSAARKKLTGYQACPTWPAHFSAAPRPPRIPFRARSAVSRCAAALGPIPPGRAALHLPAKSAGTPPCPAAN